MSVQETNRCMSEQNALSTHKGSIQQGPKLKDTFISKGRLKWTRLCEILLTVIIVSVCISIVIFQTVQCITKYVRIHKNIAQCRMHNLIFIYILNTFNAIYRYLFQVFSQGHFDNRTCKIYDRYDGKSKCTIYWIYRMSSLRISLQGRCVKSVWSDKKWVQKQRNVLSWKH